jgi:hypothetical protein
MLRLLSFCSESFDLVLLCTRIAVIGKQTGRRDVKMQKQGNRIKWMSLGGVRFCEIKTLCEFPLLLPLLLLLQCRRRRRRSCYISSSSSDYLFFPGAPGTSLSSLGESAGVGRSKGIFPFSKLTSPAYLLEPRLPAAASEWVSDLDASKSPSQQEVDEANAAFDEMGMTCVGNWLDHYLGIDCEILQKAIVSLHDNYYALLGLSFIESRRSTVSSFSTCAAQTDLARHCRPGQLFVNHQRLFSILNGLGMRGGLCQTSR